MGMLDKLNPFSSAAAAASGLVKELGDAGDKLFTSDAERLAFQLKATELQQHVLTMQHELNLKDADSTSKFKSYWRPAFGWLGLVAMAVAYVIAPIVDWVTHMVLTGAYQSVDMPMDEIQWLVGALLGIGFFRTVDKAVKR